MMDALWWSLVTQAVGFGLSAFDMPGPLQAFLINNSLRYGWRRSIWMVLAPLVIDPPLIVLFLFAHQTLLQILPIMENIIYLLGGAFILYLAWGAWQDLRADVTTSGLAGDEASDMSGFQVFTRALGLNVFSPGPYLFWGTVLIPLLQTALDASAFHAVSFLLAFYGTFLGGWVVLAVVLSSLRQLDDRFMRGLLWVTFGLLVFFGFQFLWRGVMGWMG